MVLNQLLLLFYFFILALDKNIGTYKIQLITRTINIIALYPKKRKTGTKKPSQEGFFIIRFIMGYF